MDIQCNLIIDSCCNLPHEVVDREGVYLLKFPYFDESGEHLDDLYRSRSAHDFYESMRNGSEPHTAQIPMPSLRAAFEWAHEQGKPAVHLSFSSGLSGTFDTACIYLEQVKQEIPDLDVRMVDTKLASVAEALLVYEALRQREKGLTAEEMVAWAEEARYFVDRQFMVDDLEALRRGGRIPASVAYAGSKLDVKPLLGIDADGKLTLTGVARGRKKGIKALCEYYLKLRCSRSERGYRKRRLPQRCRAPDGPAFQGRQLAHVPRVEHWPGYRKPCGAGDDRHRVLGPRLPRRHLHGRPHCQQGSRKEVSKENFGLGFAP